MSTCWKCGKEIGFARRCPNCGASMALQNDEASRIDQEPSLPAGASTKDGLYISRKTVNGIAAVMISIAVVGLLVFILTSMKPFGMNPIAYNAGMATLNAATGYFKGYINSEELSEIADEQYDKVDAIARMGDSAFFLKYKISRVDTYSFFVSLRSSSAEDYEKLREATIELAFALWKPFAVIGI